MPSEPHVLMLNAMLNAVPRAYASLLNKGIAHMHCHSHMHMLMETAQRPSSHNIKGHAACTTCTPHAHHTMGTAQLMASRMHPQLIASIIICC